MNAYLSPGTGEGLEGSSRVTDEEQGAEPQGLLTIQVEEEGAEPQGLLMIQMEEEEGGVELRRHLRHSELRFHLLVEELELCCWCRW